MKRVLAIAASPRRGGNTETLLDEFLLGLTKAGGAFEKVVLSDLKIAPCREDHYCLKTGECSITDDATEVFRKILEADQIVLASPVFFYALPAHLKALVDRVELYFIRKYSLKQSLPGTPRKAYVIMVGATEGERTFEGSLATLKEFFSTLNTVIHGRTCFKGIEKIDDLKRRPQLLSEAREAGKRFVEA